MPGSMMAAGAAGAGEAGLSFSSILPYLPIILSVLGELFKKSPEEEARDLQKQLEALGLKAPYQSPYLQKLDPVIAQALLAQLKRTSNWGWPAGMGMDTGFIEEALKNILTPQKLITGGFGGITRRRRGGVLGD